MRSTSTRGLAQDRADARARRDRRRRDRVRPQARRRDRSADAGRGGGSRAVARARCATAMSISRARRALRARRTARLHLAAAAERGAVVAGVRRDRLVAGDGAVAGSRPPRAGRVPAPSCSRPAPGRRPLAARRAPTLPVVAVRHELFVTGADRRHRRSTQPHVRVMDATPTRGRTAAASWSAPTSRRPPLVDVAAHPGLPRGARVAPGGAREERRRRGARRASRRCAAPARSRCAPASSRCRRTARS